MKDYYALLGIKSNATKKEIKKNYRILANKYHPDKNPDPKAAAKFVAITEAYDVLNDKKSRTNYDLHKWARIKQKEKKKEEFTAYVAPVESLRSKRNKAQYKRSMQFHKVKEGSKKSLLLAKEGLYIFSRYILHFLGMALISLILYSSILQLNQTFQQNIIRGLVVALFSCLLVYGIFRLLAYVFVEFKTDITSFTKFYKIPHSKASTISLSVLITFLLICCAIYFL